MSLSSSVFQLRQVGNACSAVWLLRDSRQRVLTARGVSAASLGWSTEGLAGGVEAVQERQPVGKKRLEAASRSHRLAGSVRVGTVCLKEVCLSMWLGTMKT